MKSNTLSSNMSDPSVDFATTLTEPYFNGFKIPDEDKFAIDSSDNSHLNNLFVALLGNKFAVSLSDFEPFISLALIEILSKSTLESSCKDSSSLEQDKFNVENIVK